VPARLLIAAAAAAALLTPAAAHAAGPQPGSPEYIQRDNQNMADAYGRQTGYQATPEFTRAVPQEYTEVHLDQLGAQLAQPNRLALTPGNLAPGWNGGNPLRRGWDGRRGQREAVSFTNRYGALLRGSVFAPLPGARDPYTGRELQAPYPGVVITPGSVQGSERMYHWLAEDLAERGYVVLVYDVQGQGTSETLPHANDAAGALPFCNPAAAPAPEESTGCPGVPAQQESNFVYGTQDALSFLLATPDAPYANRNGADAPVNAFNPLWGLLDHSPDRHTATPGRTTRVAVIGHSLGAAAVSYLQGVDDRVETVVALDKLFATEGQIQTFGPVEPVVPALAVQSEYGFTVQPYWLNNGSSLTPQPGPPTQAPDPRREERTGFDAWRAAGIDTMLVVPRASTHLEYTDIAYALPASRYGQALTSVYVQAWLDRYLKHARPAPAADPLMATSFRYLEPVDVGRWEPATLDRQALLSFSFCSGYALRDPRAHAARTELDIGGVGGC
jgi:dienelactone hydrolase